MLLYKFTVRSSPSIRHGMPNKLIECKYPFNCAVIVYRLNKEPKLGFIRLEHTSYHTTLMVITVKHVTKRLGRNLGLGMKASSSKGIAYKIFDIDNAISKIAGVYM